MCFVPETRKISMPNHIFINNIDLMAPYLLSFNMIGDEAKAGCT